MVAPFNQAWMLLKQRGHELNLPPPRTGGRPTGFSPQDLTDSRVDEASIGRGALDEFEYLNSLGHPSFSNLREATNEMGRRREITDEMESQISHAKAAEFNERMAEQMQRKLDQQTLARMGQQPEADEMEAMGMPEMDETGMPMSRSIGGRGPAPSEGRAGSSGRPPIGRHDLSDKLVENDPKFAEEFTNHLNQLGPLSNPFTQKPATTQHLENSLEDWAAGAGREAGMPQQAFDDTEENEGLHPNNPAAHNIGSNNARASPRQQRRGQMDSGRPYFKRPDRERPYNFSSIENPSPTLNTTD